MDCHEIDILKGVNVTFIDGTNFKINFFPYSVILLSLILIVLLFKYFISNSLNCPNLI